MSSYVIRVEFELGSKLLLPMHISSHPPPSNHTHHPPSSADRPLHGAVLGQWPPSKADHLDAIAARVPPLVALVAGQVARGSPFRGKAACSSVSSCFRVHATSVSGAQGSGYHCGEKSHVLSPDPVLQSWRSGGLQTGRGGGRPSQVAALPTLDSACTWLQSGGQREDQTECVPCFPPLSPEDVPSRSAPSTGILASPEVSYLPHPDPPCRGHCGCGWCPACVPQPRCRIFGKHQG